jgi:uncharacterized protein (TIGR03435 family)
MRRMTCVLFLTAILAAQSGWQTISIGPPTGIRNQGSAFELHAEGIPVIRVISRAYAIPEHRIVGPSWLSTERYAITAVPNDRDAFRPLMQKQLAEWFHLQAHTEQRVIPVFILKKSESTQPPDNRPASATRPALTMPQATMESFAAILSDVVHRPVFNETKLDGVFDIKLNYEFNNIGSIQQAVRQQLGLDLVDDKRSVELLIIDTVEKAQLK